MLIFADIKNVSDLGFRYSEKKAVCMSPFVLCGKVYGLLLLSTVLQFRNIDQLVWITFPPRLKLFVLNSRLNLKDFPPGNIA